MIKTKISKPASPDSLVVGRREAAHLLGISPRMLFSLTKAKKIRSFKIGRRVLYSRAYLVEWVRKNIANVETKAEENKNSEPKTDGKDNSDVKH